MRIFEQLESEVRGYVRSFPVIFDKAQGSNLHDEHDNTYIDFFAGAGTLNYGHNNPVVSEALIEYLQDNRIVHGLDMATSAKRDFLNAMHDYILQPRNMDYKIQFTGPTGTNAVETALKLARMVKKRSNVIAFTNGYHGLTMGSLAITGNDFYRDEHYGARMNADSMPFDGYFGKDINTIDYLRKMIADKSSGIDLPAAIVVETVQGEGGINVASNKWLQELEKLCREFDILLIIDDIQVGNGRTGDFFSFEQAGIKPDMITLSKSIGGGLPMAVVLLRPELDQWKPGEHTGTFRGNNLAFIASTRLLEHYWSNEDFSEAIKHKGSLMENELRKIIEKYSDLNIQLRGRGMVWGLDFERTGFAQELSKQAFKNNLIIELAGPEDNVIKFLPALTIDEKDLLKGISILDESIQDLITQKDNLYSGAA